MTLVSVSPQEAARMQRQGAVLVDIRNPDEFARASIAGSQNHPLDRIGPLARREPVVFLCRSGQRTAANAARLAACHPAQAHVLDGGLEAWRAAGLPVRQDARAPIEIMRQVQIAAGGLVLTGVILGLLAGPAWFALAGTVGAGLVFAGVSGWCGMARTLARAPWNRRASR
ncbi:MAG: rhodanese family protein [Qipengyuania sp.]|nr:rhodanese family protein [Qipengyuania sp.]